MSHSRTMSVEETAQLDAWLDSKQMQLQDRPSRDLCDVVNVAKLFRELDFKLPEAYSFVSHSSLSRKLQNWETFNLLVLRRMGITLARPALEALASGRPGALRALLYQVMCAERNGIKPRSALRTSPAKKDYQQQDEQSEAEEHLLLPSSEYEKLIHEGNIKDKCISSINQRIQCLEAMKELKEDHINNLLEHLALISVRILTLQIRLRNQERKQKYLPNQNQKQQKELKICK